MKEFLIAACLSAAAMMLSNTNTALAQAVANAQMHGVIGDPSGAAIGGAQIKARHADTGLVQSTVSSADGSFVLPNLPVGPYSFEVTAQGFNNYVQSGINLQVGNNVQM